MPRLVPTFSRQKLVLALLALTACSEPQAGPSGVPERVLVQPYLPCNPEEQYCGGNPGPHQPDLDPGAPGYWLGFGTGPAFCYSASGANINDADRDKFDDWCEKTIAQRFRPLLRFSPYDCNRQGERYWAAHYFPETERFRVAYLLAYYKDCGTPSTIFCDISVSGDRCLGHQGDSEFIVVDLYWDEATNHWVVHHAFLTAHYTESGFLDPFLGPADASQIAYNLEWLDVQGGRFLVWVAEGKHGNYPSKSSCNGGGYLSLDTCARHDTLSANTELFAWDANRNLGSSTRKLINCVRAVGTEAYFRTRTECFWTDQHFMGWWPYTGTIDPATVSRGYKSDLLPRLLQTFMPLGVDYSLSRTF